MTLGQRIASRRRSAELTQQDLAIKAGLHAITISRIERDAVEPDLSTLQALADAFEVPVAELLADPQPEAAAR